MTHALPPLAPDASAKRLFSLFLAGSSFSHGQVLAQMLRSSPGIMSEVKSHALCDEWLDFCHSSLDEFWAKREGSLYVARNPVTPAFVKVGMTSGDASKRVQALSTAGVVGRYICVQSWRVHDRFYIERAVHAQLTKEGVMRHKEHFAATWQQVCPLVEKAVASDRALFEKQGFILKT